MISKLAVGFTLLGVAISTMFFGAQTTNSQTRTALPISQDSRDYTTITKVSVSSGVKINQTHLFQGEINRKGLAVGYHHRTDGKDFVNAKLVKITGLPNSQGIYTGRVEIRNPTTGKWVSKLSSSTFFPDRWSQAQVLAEIRGAFATVNPPKEFWQGTSPSGIRIEGYYSKVTNTISTAYPVYRR
jgi:hypothetical protein